MVAKFLLATFPVAAWLVCLGVDAAHAIDTDSLPFLTGQDRKAVVIVRNESRSSEGTGVIIGYDHARRHAYVLSANHIVDQGDGSVFLHGDRERPAKNVWYSLEKDLCVMAVQGAPPSPCLEIDPRVPLTAGETHLVAVGRDQAGLKQHPGSFVGEIDFSQGTVAARCLELEVVAMPGFSGGPLLALSSGRPVIVGLLTHGSANRASGPTADEILKFLAEAGVPVGASGPAENVVSNPYPSTDVNPDFWTDEGLADEDDPELWWDDDFVNDAGDDSMGDDGLTTPDELRADFERTMADLQARLDAITDQVDVATSIRAPPSAPAIQTPPSLAPRRADERRPAESEVQVVEIPGYGVRIVIRSQ